MLCNLGLRFKIKNDKSNGWLHWLISCAKCKVWWQDTLASHVAFVRRLPNITECWNSTPTQSFAHVFSTEHFRDKWCHQSQCRDEDLKQQEYVTNRCWIKAVKRNCVCVCIIQGRNWKEVGKHTWFLNHFHSKMYGLWKLICLSM